MNYEQFFVDCFFGLTVIFFGMTLCSLVFLFRRANARFIKNKQKDVRNLFIGTVVSSSCFFFLLLGRTNLPLLLFETGLLLLTTYYFRTEFFKRKKELGLE